MSEGHFAFGLQFGEGWDVHAWPYGIHYGRKREFVGSIGRARRHHSNRPAHGDAATTNVAVGGSDSQFIYLDGATSGTLRRFKAPFPPDRPGRAALPARQ
jgi:hypothetical protein